MYEVYSVVLRTKYNGITRGEGESQPWENIPEWHSEKETTITTSTLVHHEHDGTTYRLLCVLEKAYLVPR